MLALLEELNADHRHGILLQLPVPAPLDGAAPQPARINPDKDVDGLTRVTAGRLVLAARGCACTPAA